MVISAKTERNLGVELLRLVSMMMILTIHILNHGKLLVIFDGYSRVLLYLLQAAGVVAVNLYALTTGYVYINSKHRWNKLLMLWLQVSFYAVGICVFGFLCNKDISTRTFLTAFFPITSNLYWYVSSYFLLFCFIPFLNKGLHALSKRQFQKLLLIGFVLFCSISWVGDFLDYLPFSVNSGYSPIWLAYLYCLGAYIKINSTDFATHGKRIYLSVYLLCTLLTWGSRYVLQFISRALLGEIVFEKIFFSYLSPTVVIGATALFLFFINLSIKKGELLKIVAPCTFGVYLIHENPIIRTVLIEGGMSRCSEMPFLSACGYMLLFALVVFAACLLVDFLRGKLFWLLHIPQLCSWIELRVRAIVSKKRKLGQ